ncbi:MAG: hypothetical protein V4539_21270 [Bacteroidota bacterium]
MTNSLMYGEFQDKPENFFYGVDQRLAFFIKLYIIFFFVFLAIVLDVLKDHFLPGLSDSKFFFFLLFPAGS